MFLEKLEIQGFKSFADKNMLVFPGMLANEKHGLTAIVGPNGSGKSNIADSVRWALGEQSMKTLRGKKSEDVIFSGSDKKNKLGMAEVSLFLNNENGRIGYSGGNTGGASADNPSPINYSQIVITRRLYRNGDSEYMINNSRSRLSDIQMLLARAKFGQKTYSVIGQGMVEGFLNTSLAERKEFFDEATGVKQYQIKRDSSLNKLQGSYENLIQARMLLSEIEPRLKSLTRQVNRLKKRGVIEEELHKLQYKYYSRIWHQINSRFSHYNNQYLELEKEKFAKDKKLAGLNRELSQLKEESAGENQFVRRQNELSRAQSEKEEISKQIARLEARTEIKLEATGKFDLSFLLNRKRKLEQEKKSNAEEVESLKKNIELDKREKEKLEREGNEIEKKINEFNNHLAESGAQNNNYVVGEVSRFLNRLLERLKAIKMETDVDKIRQIIRETEKEISRQFSLLNKCGKNTGRNNEGHWSEIRQELKNWARRKEKHAAKINDNNLRISVRSERVKLLLEKTAELAEEINSIDGRIEQKSGGYDLVKTHKELSALKNNLFAVEKKIENIREEINRANAGEESKKNKLFSLQKNLQDLQDEINLLNNRLSEIKINSTRYETRLEDLEIEIREEMGGLREIKQSRAAGREDVDENAKDKIKQLKRQLELIGGIDPQIEREYRETEERYGFLSTQVRDLTGAINSLETIIKELDTTIKNQFDKEFKIIAKKFEQYFKILFNGGSAKIIKVIDEGVIGEKQAAAGSGKSAAEEPDDGRGPKNKNVPNNSADLKRIKFLQKHSATGLAGIEIQATPPGKKIKSISMLSGGERALTAIALICAIISANPSPFVVLDEVDAALDEANSERLAKILDELSGKTQFIVITHNRATMRRANILYGITMGDDGVSKLLSIKLDEAGKHIG